MMRRRIISMFVLTLFLVGSAGQIFSASALDKFPAVKEGSTFEYSLSDIAKIYDGKLYHKETHIYPNGTKTIYNEYAMIFKATGTFSRLDSISIDRIIDAEKGKAQISESYEYKYEVSGEYTKQMSYIYGQKQSIEQSGKYSETIEDSRANLILNITFDSNTGESPFYFAIPSFNDSNADSWIGIWVYRFPNVGGIDDYYKDLMDHIKRINKNYAVTLDNTSTTLVFKVEYKGGEIRNDYWDMIAEPSSAPFGVPSYGNFTSVNLLLEIKYDLTKGILAYLKYDVRGTYNVKKETVYGGYFYNTSIYEVGNYTFELHMELKPSSWVERNIVSMGIGLIAIAAVVAAVIIYLKRRKT